MINLKAVYLRVIIVTMFYRIYITLVNYPRSILLVLYSIHIHVTPDDHGEWSKSFQFVGDYEMSEYSALKKVGENLW